MAATILYLLLLSPVFLFTVWHLTSSISPPPIPETLTGKRIILVIAHPDDESMFFSPTVQTLTRPELGNHMKILCLSTGDSEGLGETRKIELEKAAVTLGLRRKEDVFVMNDERFRDGMKEDWSHKEIARVLAQAFAPHLIPNTTSSHARTASGVDIDTKHKRTFSDASKRNGNAGKPALLSPTSASPAPTTNPRENKTSQDTGPHASIDVLLTFDSSGISGHPNHISLFHGSKLFLQHLMKGHSGYSCPVALYTLSTTNLMRKYSFIFDVLTTYVVNICSSIFGRSSQNKSVKAKSTDDRVIFVNDIPKYMKAREAMVRGHQSQMVWFRWGWISLGRYMVVNDLKRAHVYSS